jgi:hypothetical protein
MILFDQSEFLSLIKSIYFSIRMKIFNKYNKLVVLFDEKSKFCFIEIREKWIPVLNNDLTKLKLIMIFYSNIHWEVSSCIKFKIISS